MVTGTTTIVRWPALLAILIQTGAIMFGLGFTSLLPPIVKQSIHKSSRSTCRIGMTSGTYPMSPLSTAHYSRRENEIPPHIVFLETVGQGHINPTLPLLAALVAKGCIVTFFADSEGNLPPDDMAREDTPLGTAIIAAGAKLRSYHFDQELFETEPRLSGLNARWLKLPALLNDLRELQPDGIIYDPFNPLFPAAARILDIPYIGLVPHSGPGTMASAETPEALERAAGAREWLMETHGLDLFTLGVPSASWYSPTLNLVLASKPFFAPMKTDAQRKLWKAGCFKCVGTLIDPKQKIRSDQADFPLDRIRAFKEGVGVDEEKKKIVLQKIAQLTKYCY